MILVIIYIFLCLILKTIEFNWFHLLIALVLDCLIDYPVVVKIKEK